MVAGQVPQVIQNLMLTELHHSQVENRVSAVKRYHVWFHNQSDNNCKTFWERTVKLPPTCKPKYLGKLLRVMASNTDTLYSQFLKPLLFYSQEVVLHLHSNTFNVWWDKETFMILLLKITWWLILCLQVLCVVDIQISGLVKTGARSTKLVQGKCMTFTIFPLHNFSVYFTTFLSHIDEHLK